MTNQSSCKETKRTIDFTILEESKKNDDLKRNGLTKWNSNSTTPQNFINEIDDYREYSNNSSIFADIENRPYEISKPTQKNQQAMMFKKKLNNVISIAKTFTSKFNNSLDFSYS
jgi:hypothetical protein